MLKIHRILSWIITKSWDNSNRKMQKYQVKMNFLFKNQIISKRSQITKLFQSQASSNLCKKLTHQAISTLSNILIIMSVCIWQCMAMSLRTSKTSLFLKLSKPQTYQIQSSPQILLLKRRRAVMGQVVMKVM